MKTDQDPAIERRTSAWREIVDVVYADLPDEAGRAAERERERPESPPTLRSIKR